MLLPHKGQNLPDGVLVSCDLGSLLSPGMRKDSLAAFCTAVSYKEQSGDRWVKAGSGVQGTAAWAPHRASLTYP